MSQFISLETAIEMTSLYRKQNEQILDPEYRGQNILATCETFDRNVLDTLLKNSQCAFIRIYYGMDTSKKVHAILVGADQNGNDILPGMLGTSVTGLEEIGENAQRCPDDCPPPSPLNE